MIHKKPFTYYEITRGEEGLQMLTVDYGGGGGGGGQQSRFNYYIYGVQIFHLIAGLMWDRSFYGLNNITLYPVSCSATSMLSSAISLIVPVPWNFDYVHVAIAVVRFKAFMLWEVLLY